MTCVECERLKLRIKIASADQRSRRVAEYQEHLRTHGLYWLRAPWVINVPIWAERRN